MNHTTPEKKCQVPGDAVINQVVDELARGIMRILPEIQSWLKEHQEDYQLWLKEHPSIVEEA